MTRKKEVIVGLVIVAAVVVGVLGTLFLKGSQWRRNLVVAEAVFQEAGQLAEGSAVRFRGVAIGAVESIAVEPSGNAVRIEMRIRREVQLPADAGVLLAPESMFGDWQAEIVSRSRFPRYQFYQSADPGPLPGFSLPDISRLTATADQIANNLTTLTDRVELAFTEETALNLKRAIDNIQDVSEGLSELVGQQAESFNRVAVEVQGAAEQLGTASVSARVTFEEVQNFLETLDADTLAVDARTAVRNFSSLSTDLVGAVDNFDRTMVSADSTLRRFDRISAQLEAGNGALGWMLTDPSGATRADSVLTQLNLLLADMRANPGRYVRLSIF